MEGFHNYTKALDEGIKVLDDLLSQGENDLTSPTAQQCPPATKTKKPISEDSVEGLEEDGEISNYTLLLAMQRLEKMHADSHVRLHRLESIVIENSASVKEMGKALEFQAQQLEDTSGQVVALQGKVSTLEKENTELREKYLQLENHSRRSNLRVSGIPECTGENVKTVVVDLLRQVSPTVADQLPLMVDIAHRLGPRSGEAGPPRRIIVRFGLRSLRDQILGDAKRSAILRERKIYISEDLSQQTKEARNVLWPLVCKARSENKRAGFRGPFAYIEGKKMSAADVLGPK